MDNSVFSNAEIDANTPLAHYWSKAKTAGLDIALLAPLSVASVQARKARANEMGQAINKYYAIQLPDRPRWSGNGQVEFLGTGPGAWLAVWSTNSPQNIDQLCSQTRNLASIADQSSAYRIFTISGAPARAFLARGLAVKISEPEFKTSSVIVSAIAHIGVILWQTDEKPTFMIAVARSYSESFCHWISEAINGVIQEDQEKLKTSGKWRR
ncbi:Sarcosine oxidase gamma subunit [hydrothermal vent metagenome]|uniref:Sarcosine oxidase gamma subunit n=1 Tax=hydrothermal vent metagenome TaxID=652676 RepID=A0A3B0U587_9ZZZZ